MLIIGEGPPWAVRQIFDDPAADHDWGISATVDLAASDEEGAAVVHVTEVGQLWIMGGSSDGRDSLWFSWRRIRRS